MVKNHSWNHQNVCHRCGVHRVRRRFKKWQRTGSVLRNGIWEHKDFYTYGIAWYYGIEEKDSYVLGIGFQRPPCDREKLKELREKIIKTVRDKISERFKIK
jgi:hypothetical protein